MSCELDLDGLEAAEDAHDRRRLSANPVLVCLYSGGMTPEQGRESLRHLISAAARIGIRDHLVLDHYPTEPYHLCESWGEYIDMLAERVDEDPDRRGRSLVVFAHSLGTHAARALTRRLGHRVLKLYPVACRPTHLCAAEPPMREIWGVGSYQELRDLSDLDLLIGMVHAWPNKFLKKVLDQAMTQLKNPLVQGILTRSRQQYGSKVYGGCLGDPESLPSLEDMQVEVPVLAFACMWEEPAGETADRVKHWREATTSSCEVMMLDSGHHECLEVVGGRNHLCDVVIEDLRKLLLDI
mmetsp:Transcript_3320/g.9414  ORF Transcript_3320/g.9414 Transcript_3320/m.9414 type:complete len:296 (-) Transcript_3320:54-941(-)